MRHLTKLVRLSLDLTQEAFARALGVQKQSVFLWESGRGRPNRERMRKMAELAPQFADELQIAIKNYKHHRQRSDASRDSLNVGERMHAAVDEILEGGSPGMKEGVLNHLEAKADLVNTSRAHDDEKAPRSPKKPLLVGPKGKSR